MAKAAKGSVFAHWEGELVDSLGLSRNELRNPSLQFIVPAGFDTNQISAMFIALDDDGLSELSFVDGKGETMGDEDGILLADVEPVEFWLADDSWSYVTASVSGLPSGDYRKSSQSVVIPEARYLFARFVEATAAGDPIIGLAAKGSGLVAESRFKWRVGVAVPEGDEWTQGTFNGEVESGLVTLTVDAKGKISGKILEGSKTWSLSAASFSRVMSLESLEPLENLAPRLTYHAMVIAKSGKEIATNEIAVAAVDGVGVVSGWPQSSAAAAAGDSRPPAWTAWQNLWKRADTKAAQPVFKKNIVMDLYLGEAGDAANCLKLTFKKDGAVSFSGMSGGKKVSGSSQLVWGGGLGEGVLPGWQVTLYVPPKGAFAGLCETIPLELATDGQNVVVDVTSR